jgi:hypothetical protein
MKLSFVLSDGKMPFGPQRIVVSGIGVASLFETGLKINTDTATTLNINKLFGKKFGRKGDLNYTAEWKCGDGVINKLDPDLVSGYIIGQIEFNDYQIWAADLTNNGRVEVDDLVELQKLVLVSGVEDELIARFAIVLREHSLYINNPNSLNGELIINDLTGKLVLKTTDLSSREIQLASGFYAYSAKAGNQYKSGVLSLGQ